MEVKDILLKLREAHQLTQAELAETLHISRQAISRWENGETVPNTETLKLLSQMFDVSINTLLGSPRQLICQCCGMPLRDEEISRETDGSFNEEYCKWCYHDGEFVYHNLEDVVNACAGFVTNYAPDITLEQAKEQLRKQIPQLKHWRDGGMSEFV